MATFVGIQSATGTSVATINVNVPAGVVNGDLLIGGTCSTSNGALPAGWNQAATFTTGSSPTLGSRLFWRLASSEPASYTFSPGNGASVTSIGFIAAYRITASPALGATTTLYDARLTPVGSPYTTPIFEAQDLFILSAMHFVWGHANALAPTAQTSIDAAINVRLNTTHSNLSMFVGEESVADCVASGFPQRRTWSVTGTSPVVMAGSAFFRDGSVAEGAHEPLIAAPRLGMQTADIPMELQFTDPNVAGGLLIIEEDM